MVTDSILSQSVTPTVDFYFDFISPYAYIASTMIEEVAARHKRDVTWLPFRLGVTVVKVMGLKPLMETPLKGEYLRRDVQRLASVFGIALTENFDPMHPVAAQRLFHALPGEIRGAYSKAVLRARWADGLDISEVATLIDIAKRLDIPPAVVDAALSEEATHTAVREATNSALVRGVFGSPTCAVGDELFWGVDRLWLLSSYLGAGEHYGVGSARVP